MSKAERIGRNDKCHCNSGKKYKKCCLDFDLAKNRPVPKEVIDFIQKEKEIMEKLKKLGIYINYVKPILYKGKKVWAIGSRLYLNRPPQETFHEFIVFVLKQTLGKEWWIEQSVLPYDKMHFIMQSFIAHNSWKTRMQHSAIKVDENLWTAIPDGWSRSLLSLAFDVASLSHSQQLPDQLITRLKNKDQYQGARYEITVATIIARLNCKIKFLDTTTDEKHCEFIATHNESGQIFAVEAKSRHRKGVLHTAGETDEIKLLKGDVDKIFNEALQQKPDKIPYYIFIDLNAPLTPDVDMENKPWFKGINNILSRKGTPTPETPDPFNAVFITNFSYHYQSFKQADPAESLSIISMFPENKLTNENLSALIYTALSNYGNIPDLDTETRF